jgi:hypothetical protein
MKSIKNKVEIYDVVLENGTGKRKQKGKVRESVSHCDCLHTVQHEIYLQ